MDYSGVTAMNYGGGTHFYIIDNEEKMRPIKRTVLEEQGHNIDAIVATSNSSKIIEFTDDEEKELSQKRERYAELLAHRQRIGMIAINATRHKVTEARDDYTKCRDSLVEVARQRHQAKNGSAKAFEEAERATVSDEIDVLYPSIAARRLELAKNGHFNSFYSWWANQGGERAGWRGKFKKIGALAVMGAATGLAVSAVVGTFGVGAVGAGVTAAVSRGVARNLARQKLDSHDAQSPTIVDAQSKRQTEEASNLQEQRWSTARGIISSKELSEAAASATEMEISRNRKRMLGAVAIGAATGLAFGVLGQWIHSEVNIRHTAPRPHVPTRLQPKPTPTPSTPTPTYPYTPPSETLPILPSSPGITDGFRDNVLVQPGGGYTNALVALANQKGIHLDGAQAWRAYLAVKSKVGGNFFTNDPSYVISRNDLGISRPGAAMWNQIAVETFQHWLQANNLASTATS